MTMMSRLALLFVAILPGLLGLVCLSRPFPFLGLGHLLALLFRRSVQYAGSFPAAFQQKPANYVHRLTAWRALAQKLTNSADF